MYLRGIKNPGITKPIKVFSISCNGVFALYLFGLWSVEFVIS